MLPKLCMFRLIQSIKNRSYSSQMETVTEAFLYKVFLYDVFAPCRMSFLIPDVFLPLDDPTFNDILNNDNYDPEEDSFQLLMEDTNFLLAHDRVISSLAAFRHRAHGSNSMLLQTIEQFGPRLFVTGINLSPNRVANLASVNLFWFLSCVGFLDIQFLALHRMIQLSIRWNIPASVGTLAGDEQKLLYEFSGRLCTQIRLTNLINPLQRQS